MNRQPNVSLAACCFECNYDPYTLLEVIKKALSIRQRFHYMFPGRTMGMAATTDTCGMQRQTSLIYSALFSFSLNWFASSTVFFRYSNSSSKHSEKMLLPILSSIWLSVQSFPPLRWRLLKSSSLSISDT